MLSAANKNQSVNKPFSIQESIIFLLVSKESNCTDSHKPAEETFCITGWCNRDKKIFSLPGIPYTKLSSNKIFIAAIPAAQLTG